MSPPFDLGEVTLRAMRESDLPRVIEIAKGLRDAPQWPESAYFAAIDPENIPLRIALVAEMASETSGKISGFLVASLIHGEAELETIAVAPDSQRKGLGRRLLKNLVEQLRQEQAQRLMLEVRSSNLAAQHLYVSCGFNQYNKRSRYYADPEEDAVLMGLNFA